MTLPIIIDHVAEMNKIGITHLAAGNVKLATTTFKHAIRTVSMSMSSTQSNSSTIPEDASHHHDNTDSEHQSSDEGLLCMDQRIPAFGTVPVASQHDARDKSSSVCGNHCMLDTTSGIAMTFYNQAFVLGAPPTVAGHNPANCTREQQRAAAKEEQVMIMCHSITLLFNLALAHQQVQQDEEEAMVTSGGGATTTTKNRRRLENAIKLYDVIVNLVMDESQMNKLCWNLLIAALYNKACALCTLSRRNEARQIICSELADAMHCTPFRPPNFEDEYVDDLLIYSVLSDDHHFGVSSVARNYAAAA